MISSNHAHYHLLRISETGKLFWAHTLLVVSMALVSVFVPIYLLKLGYHLPAILLFLAFQGLLSLPLQVGVAYAIPRIGPHRLMAVGIAMQVIYFLLLIDLPKHHWPLLLVAFFWAAYRTSYWIAFHINFSRSSHHLNSPRSVGMLQTVVTFAKGIAPAIGGICAQFFGIGSIYVVAIVMSLLAIMPLLREPERPYRHAPSLRRLAFRKVRPDLLASFANGLTTISESVIWPILVFIIVGTYASVGILSSVVALASISTALYVSWRAEHKGTKHYLTEGVTLSSLSDMLRLLAQNSGHVFGINLFTGVGNSMYYTPFFSRYYIHAGEESRIEYTTAMELVHELAWGIAFLLLFVATLFVSDKTALLLGIAMAIPANFVIRKIR